MAARPSTASTFSTFSAAYGTQPSVFSTRSQAGTGEYTDEDVDELAIEFEAACKNAVDNSTSMVKRRAADADLLQVAEKARNTFLEAVKADKNHLREVFEGTGLQRFHRFRSAMQSVQLSDMYATDARWNDLRDSMDTVEAVLKDLGVWKELSQSQPPESLRYDAGMKRQFLAGDRVKLKPEHDGGDANSFTISPDLPEGLKINAITGKIKGTLTPGVEVPEQTYTITAMNDAGETATKITFGVKVVEDVVKNQDQPELPETSDEVCVCGNVLMSDAKYCRQCGKKRGEDPTPDPPPQQEPELAKPNTAGPPSGDAPGSQPEPSPSSPTVTDPPTNEVLFVQVPEPVPQMPTATTDPQGGEPAPASPSSPEPSDPPRDVDMASPGALPFKSQSEPAMGPKKARVLQATAPYGTVTANFPKGGAPSQSTVLMTAPSPSAVPVVSFNLLSAPTASMQVSSPKQHGPARPTNQPKPQPSQPPKSPVKQPPPAKSVKKKAQQSPPKNPQQPALPSSPQAALPIAPRNSRTGPVAPSDVPPPRPPTHTMVHSPTTGQAAPSPSALPVPVSFMQPVISTGSSATVWQSPIAQQVPASTNPVASVAVPAAVPGQGSPRTSNPVSSLGAVPSSGGPPKAPLQVLLGPPSVPATVPGQASPTTYPVASVSSVPTSGGTGVPGAPQADLPKTVGPLPPTGTVPLPLASTRSVPRLLDGAGPSMSSPRAQPQVLVPSPQVGPPVRTKRMSSSRGTEPNGPQEADPPTPVRSTRISGTSPQVPMPSARSPPMASSPRIGPRLSNSPRTPFGPFGSQVRAASPGVPPNSTQLMPWLNRPQSSPVSAPLRSPRVASPDPRNVPGGVPGKPRPPSPRRSSVSVMPAPVSTVPAPASTMPAWQALPSTPSRSPWGSTTVVASGPRNVAPAGWPSNPPVASMPSTPIVPSTMTMTRPSWPSTAPMASMPGLRPGPGSYCSIPPPMASMLGLRPGTGSYSSSPPSTTMRAPSLPAPRAGTAPVMNGQGGLHPGHSASVPVASQQMNGQGGLFPGFPGHSASVPVASLSMIPKGHWEEKEVTRMERYWVADGVDVVR